ncbi:hypothetical protein POTOM_031250 [Populus tomentosa]|uniref:Cytosolic endo-beta-N-acetylglucosaminidase C-terminal domain-containing protein n=1 Tax=Populus tomentosa TaxID=118781 RepID=A0A8X8CRG9_POPTO|nr:hypothetical protein POTOM_031250 [Populus tomentosa]
MEMIFLFPKYNKQVDGNATGKLVDTREYLGTAHVQGFYMSGLSIPCHVGSLKFSIQVCAADGTCQELEDSPYMLLDVGVSINMIKMTYDKCFPCNTNVL